MRKVILALAMLASMSVSAQDFKVLRGDCTPEFSDGDKAESRAVTPHRLPAINTQWDPSRTYRQMVILVAFEGDSTYFNMENPRETYNSMFNERGYNRGLGKGCVADYFRDQSYGMFNLQFDIFGPYETSEKAQPYDNPTSSTHNYGRDAMVEAAKMLLNENPNQNFSVYDWNGDGYVNQLIFIFAGYTGNAGAKYGYVWPNTSSFSTMTTPDGLKISNYTVSAESWPTTSKTSCGIGTICHEFAHSLGLPDIYPTSSSAGYSMVDEWDLMDGGNFTNYGWCPPNFTALEKMLMGWLTPIELSEATTITGMKSIEDGGEVYMIKHTDNEYYLLENRQWKGWDAGAPGQGLVVYHVDYDASKWRMNAVNNTKGSPCFSLVNADSLDYDGWDDLIKARGSRSPYLQTSRMHNYHLSSSPYPWTTDSTDYVNDHLTDSSMPASLMYNKNEAGSNYLSKAITNIRVSDDGLVSFDFMKEELDAVSTVSLTEQPTRVYNLRGYCVGSRLESQRPGIYIIRYADGTTKKVVRR